MSGRASPGPLRGGSTTCRAKPTATAASNALPPCSSSAIPAAVANQCVEATMPKVPASCGRGGVMVLLAVRSDQPWTTAVVEDEVTRHEFTRRPDRPQRRDDLAAHLHRHR